MGLGYGVKDYIYHDGGDYSGRCPSKLLHPESRPDTYEHRRGMPWVRVWDCKAQGLGAGLRFRYSRMKLYSMCLPEVWEELAKRLQLGFRV